MLRIVLKLFPSLLFLVNLDCPCPRCHSRRHCNILGRWWDPARWHLIVPSKEIASLLLVSSLPITICLHLHLDSHSYLLLPATQKCGLYEIYACYEPSIWRQPLAYIRHRTSSWLKTLRLKTLMVNHLLRFGLALEATKTLPQTISNMQDKERSSI